jgi:hypothetical protein
MGRWVNVSICTVLPLPPRSFCHFNVPIVAWCPEASGSLFFWFSSVFLESSHLALVQHHNRRKYLPCQILRVSACPVLSTSLKFENLYFAKCILPCMCFVQILILFSAQKIDILCSKDLIYQYCMQSITALHISQLHISL